MAFNQTMCQTLSLADVLHSQSLTTAGATGAAIDMSIFERCMFVLDVGALGSSGTVDFKLQCSANGTSGWTDLAGKSITQITTNGNKDVKVGVTSEDLAISSLANARYVRWNCAIGVAASQICVMAFGSVGRFKPEANFGQSTSTSTVSD